jgi:hypothetical protein
MSVRTIKSLVPRKHMPHDKGVALARLTVKK